jgi:hypothetical protein
MKDDDNPTKYQKISGKYKKMFGIPNNLLKILHKDLYELYSQSHIRNLVKPKSIHTIITHFFVNEYYPIISKNYHMDEHTKAILMGTIGFNMNIPQKLNKLLYTETDDIDLKIYTTKLHYDKRKNKPENVKSVLSIFRYIVMTLFMYMKQIMYELIEFSKNIFMTLKPIYKKSKKEKDNNNNDNDNNKDKDKNNNSYSYNYDEDANGDANEDSDKNADDNSNGSKKSKQSQDGGDIKQLIKYTQKSYGVMNSGSIYIQLKNNSNKEQINEKIDITRLSYDELYHLIFEKINDVDLLITSKIKYWINYSKLLNIPKFVNALTFSDTKIYYPNLLENTTFYAYYLLNNKNNTKNDTKHNLTLDKLYNNNINITDIIKIKNCGKHNNYNCNYISPNSLKLDLILMLQYAEFINDENYETNNIIVPISSLFKYIKYFTKFLKLYIIIKFYNKTLNKDYMNITIKLIKYINRLYNKTLREPEISPINVAYKKLINKLHQDFFIKKTMFPEYELLREVVNDYNTIKYYINKSRFLFKDLYETYEKKNKLLNETNVSLLNILSIIFKKDDNSNSYNSNLYNTTQDGGKYKKTKDTKDNKNKKYILYNDINDDITNEYCELIVNPEFKSKLTKKINKKKQSQEQNKLITNIIDKTLKNDIKTLKKITI